MSINLFILAFSYCLLYLLTAFSYWIVFPRKSKNVDYISWFAYHRQSKHNSKTWQSSWSYLTASLQHINLSREGLMIMTKDIFIYSLPQNKARQGQHLVAINTASLREMNLFLMLELNEAASFGATHEFPHTSNPLVRRDAQRRKNLMENCEKLCGRARKITEMIDWRHLRHFTFIICLRSACCCCWSTSQRKTQKQLTFSCSLNFSIKTRRKPNRVTKPRLSLSLSTHKAEDSPKYELKRQENSRKSD